MNETEVIEHWKRGLSPKQLEAFEAIEWNSGDVNEYSRLVNISSNETKKEVFDDILSYLHNPAFSKHDIEIAIQEKKIHLSTVQKEKQHNNDFKKPCNLCDGTGKVSNKNLVCCPQCKGRGFIKS